jgi:hypothetical protein
MIWIHCNQPHATILVRDGVMVWWLNPFRCVHIVLLLLLLLPLQVTCTA